MTSNKPYLIRAIFDWLVDNKLTPYILVDADVDGVQVPQDFVNNGRIVLNISPEACRGLHLENDRIVFTARFGGITNQIFVVPRAVLAIYAKENGRGMEFGEDLDDAIPATSTTEKGKGKPALSLVRKDSLKDD